MSALEPLAPDQRAVVALVLQQRRSYDEIAALLGMPVDAVRARARAGLASLAHDNGLPDEVTGTLADYLLGQQQAADAEAARALLAESAPARAWATRIAAQLEQLTPNVLPDIPGAAPARAGDDPSAAVPASPGDDPPRASSRIGGALLIAGVLAVVALVLFLALRGGDDPAAEPAAAGATPTATASPTPATAQVADRIALRSPDGGDAKGTMTVYLQEGQLLFALEARDVPPSSAGAAYGVWLTGPGDRARRLGFTNPVGDDGQLGIHGPGESDIAKFPKLYATYARVAVSRETSEDARRPGPVVLSGRLPAGRAGG